MEEESKGRENNNNVEGYSLIKNIPSIPKIEIPKVEFPPIETPGPEERIATAEQLKSFYNSEQWKDVKEGIERMFGSVIKILKPIMEAVAEVVKHNYIKLMKIYTIDPEIKKCYRIYKRTKKRKNEKKANEQN